MATKCELLHIGRLFPPPSTDAIGQGEPDFAEQTPCSHSSLRPGIIDQPRSRAKACLLLEYAEDGRSLPRPCSPPDRPWLGACCQPAFAARSAPRSVRRPHGSCHPAPTPRRRQVGSS